MPFARFEGLSLKKNSNYSPRCHGKLDSHAVNGAFRVFIDKANDLIGFFVTSLILAPKSPTFEVFTLSRAQKILLNWTILS
jgi:hypothetical protein